MDVGLRNARLNFRQVEPFYVEQGYTPVGELIRFQNFREPSCRRNAAQENISQPIILFFRVRFSP